jgi:bacillithiol system protein YtxJ
MKVKSSIGQQAFSGRSTIVKVLFWSQSPFGNSRSHLYARNQATAVGHLLMAGSNLASQLLSSWRGRTMDNFISVTETSDLDQLVAQSKQQTVVIFKHSLTCPVSSSAYQEMTRFPGSVNLVEVQRARELSREIEHRTGIRHESPQVIVLRNGQVVWDASHFKITADAVSQAVKEAERT